MTWRDLAQESILAAVKEHAGEPPDDVEKAIRAAYPFGERRRWPYKVWLRCVREAMNVIRGGPLYGTHGLGELKPGPAPLPGQAELMGATDDDE